MVTSHTLIIFHAGPGLALKGAVFPNHSVLRRVPHDIGEDEDALYCVTDDVTCCGTPPNATDGGSGNGRGYWHFPNSIELQSGTANEFLWYARWLTGAVLMNFRGSASTGTAGLHRCVIRDSTDTLHLFYTCIYSEAGYYNFSCKCMTLFRQFVPLEYTRVFNFCAFNYLGLQDSDFM